MYNIVIFSGGTGSIALQEGLSDIYGNESYNLDIIINAYDNGKSTGTCRKVFGNKILGPSDLRKNHMTQFKIQHTAALKNPSSGQSTIYRMFNLRLDATSKEDYYHRACNLLEKNQAAIDSLVYEQSKVGGGGIYLRLKELLNYFFFEDIQGKVWRKELEGEQFTDFSLANVFYSACAAANGFSLRNAGKEMATLLGIKDNVHLISDVNLYLNARCHSGYIITDEEDIVEWDNPQDKIEEVMLLKDGIEYLPTVDERVDLTKVRSIKSILSNADIIILSSGTQWSSLIPSYMHSGLCNILEESKAKKYVVMNNTQDRDMKGVMADEIIDIIGRYIPIKDFTAVVNKDAALGMNQVTKIKSISGHIGGQRASHNPIKLVELVMEDYFALQGFCSTFVFDLDGTLWDERASNQGKAIGYENMNLFKGIVHSGNSFEHIRNVFKYLYHQDSVCQIYSDFGNVHFNSTDYTAYILVKNCYEVNIKVAEELEKVDAFKGKVKIRGAGCVVTIKPLVDREALIEKVRACLASFGGLYVAQISGNTSIDVTHKDYNKKTMLKKIIEANGLNVDQVIFVGNETTEGSEANLSELGVKTIQVDDVWECNILLKTLKVHRV